MIDFSFEKRKKLSVQPNNFCLYFYAFWSINCNPVPWFDHHVSVHMLPYIGTSSVQCNALLALHAHVISNLYSKAGNRDGTVGWSVLPQPQPPLHSGITEKRRVSRPIACEECGVENGVLYVRQLSDSLNWGSRGREPYTSW
jgi:hypothetical protein